MQVCSLQHKKKSPGVLPSVLISAAASPGETCKRQDCVSGQELWVWVGLKVMNQTKVVWLKAKDVLGFPCGPVCPGELSHCD